MEWMVPQSDREVAFESGQYLIDKTRCWRELRMALWYAEHSDFVFRVVYGDKECFHLAWRFLGTEYAMPRKAPGWNQHTIVQYDFADQIVFQHRCQDKWRLGGNRRNNSLANARYLRPGMGCVDVGANYGYYTLLRAGACGLTGRVVACEPNPLLAETYLPQNLALNGFYHGVEVEICPKVVGNLDDRTADFALHEGVFATSSLERWAYRHRAETVRVPVITVDRLRWEEGKLGRIPARIDLLKANIQGGEIGLLREAEQTLACDRPLLCLEFEPYLREEGPFLELPGCGSTATRDSACSIPIATGRGR